MPIAAGTRFGSYEIVEAIGSGGMGEVYRATDTNLKRDVAIKVLPESFASNPDRLARFQREAELLASLNHANIAQIFGLEKADGRTVIVMELVEGPTLADRIKEGPIPPDEALGIARQVADALEAAHGAQVVHRDLKPANINLKPDGSIKVLDFGIAKALDADAISGGKSPVMTTPAVTETGVILGTAAYMSPEQARGRPVDQRTDIWAFGCLLFEMLTGQPAFGGEDVMLTLARVLDRDTDLSSMPGTISPAVRHTIKLCLEKDARKRIADIRDVRLALDGRFETELPSAARIEAAGPAWRRSLRYAGALLVGALLVAIAGFVLWPDSPAPRVSRYYVTPPPEAPLARMGGYDVAVSPDGSRLAYFAADPQNNRVQLYVRDRDSLEARPLAATDVPNAGNSNPFFSADGRWVGLRAPGEGIMRVPVDGAPPTKILDDITAFLGGTVTADGMLIYSDGTSLNRISASGGGRPERLTGDVDGGPLLYIGPVLLPGERAVLYAQANTNVAVLDLETREERVLIEGGQNPFYADGYIVFARGTTVMAAPFDVARLEVTGEPAAIFDGVRNPGGNTAVDYALAANGTLVYVPHSEEDNATSALIWVDRTGQPTGFPLSETETVDTPRSPRLSPDGQRLALVMGLPNSGAVWIFDLRGRPPIPLADEGDNVHPIWSPDGRTVALVSSRSGTTYDLYALPADGSVLEPSPLSSEPIAAIPEDWSDDGELIIVNPNPGDIMSISVENPSEARDLVVTPDDENDAALSPNGRWLAYATNRTGQYEIWVKAYPDGVPQRVSRNGGREPRWSRDGRELFYLQGSAMMAVAVDTDGEFSFAPAEELFPGGYVVNAASQWGSYDVAPDGSFLMVTPTGGVTELGASSPIVVVEDWIEEVKRLAPAD